MGPVRVVLRAEMGLFFEGCCMPAKAFLLVFFAAALWARVLGSAHGHLPQRKESERSVSLRQGLQSSPVLILPPGVPNLTSQRVGSEKFSFLSVKKSKKVEEEQEQASHEEEEEGDGGEGGSKNAKNDEEADDGDGEGQDSGNEGANGQEDKEGGEDDDEEEGGKGPQKHGKKSEAPGKEKLEYDKFVGTEIPSLLEPELPYTSGTQLCASMKCARIGSGAPANSAVKGCKRVIRCRDCTSQVTARGFEETCAFWKAAEREIVLADGWLATGEEIVAGGTLELDIDWKSGDALDFTKCAPDLKQVVQGLEEVKKKGNIDKFPLFIPVALMYSRSQSAIGKKENIKNKNFPAVLQFDDGVSRLQSVNHGGVLAGAPMCPSNNSHIAGSTLHSAETEFAVSWFSVPAASSATITPGNFKVVVKCGNRTSCDLSGIAVCVRISCRPITTDLIQRRDALTAAMLEPVATQESPSQAASSAANPNSAEGSLPSQSLPQTVNLHGALSPSLVMGPVGSPVLPETRFFMQQVPTNRLLAHFYTRQRLQSTGTPIPIHSAWIVMLSTVIPYLVQSF